jgi:predicted SnoaL-like aldol condensation-catalyzing enzyme
MIMLSSDHPNAIWLATQYRGRMALATDPGLDEETRERLVAEHQREMFTSVSPDWIIHTAGRRLAASGDLEFAAAMGRRRAELAPEFILEVGEVVADDHFGIIHLSYRICRGERVMEGTSFGVWRFEDGMAVEHWEMSPAREWDEFFLDADPEFTEGTAVEFWTKQ